MIYRQGDKVRYIYVDQYEDLAVGETYVVSHAEKDTISLYGVLGDYPSCYFELVEDK